MSILIAIILGLVQGLSEFLPISSSGHLVLVEKLLGVQGENITFNIILHLATALAVIIAFRKDIFKLIKNPFTKQTLFLLISTIITGVIAFLFKDMFTESYTNDIYILGFIVTIIFLSLADYAMKKGKNIYSMSYLSASVVGAFQGLAIFPGVSRSGSTVASLVTMGVKKEEALSYSFILSLPIILGGALLELTSSSGLESLKNIGYMNILVGFSSAFLAGLLAIKFMLKLVRKSSFKPFIIYLSILTFTLVLFKYFI